MRGVVFGCSGPSLTAWEQDFFAEVEPYGLILFARNVERPNQVRALTAAFREVVGRANAPVLIDQEGGRVTRFGPPHWRASPAAGVIGALADEDLALAREASWTHARLMAAELHAAGVTVDCAPVLDLRLPDQHEIVGDRAFAADPVVVAELGRAALRGFLAGGVMPVIKHIPGHGRALVDSHLELPVVEADRDTLEAHDFEAFRLVADEAPWAMSAHVLYTAIDPERPATVSQRVIEEVIRGSIGFRGVLISDDINMKALSGNLAERTAAILDAGCDLALHCNGNAEEMREVAAACGEIAPESLARIESAAARLVEPEPLNVAQLGARLDALIEAA